MERISEIYKVRFAISNKMRMIVVDGAQPKWQRCAHALGSKKVALVGPDSRHEDPSSFDSLLTFFTSLQVHRRSNHTILPTTDLARVNQSYASIRCYT